MSDFHDTIAARAGSGAGAGTGAGSWIDRWRAILGRLTVVDSERALEDDLLTCLAGVEQPRVLAFVNAHAMNSAVSDVGFAAAVAEADWVLRDGSGMKMLMDRLGLPAGLNLNGTDLIPLIVARYGNRRILLAGTRDPQLSVAAARIRDDLAPGAKVDALDGFLAPEVYVTKSRELQPELIVLGMGMPKQEQVAQQLRRALSGPVLIVCGGAILDFLGGGATRAPLWMRRLGVEWLYRLLREPRRLFKRYVIGNPLFLSRARRYAAATRAAARHGRDVP
ncbi:WecB/TagA/CpsF family glycosyltransferase [Roseateles sp.]|uniref:WecB/TagA/CpsF family glycosyltransferase n=1 Tax=Roseateles sp. TaxID=1971397 RepID=UPI0031D519E3